MGQGERWAELVDLGTVRSACLVEEVQQGMTVEVDPDEVSCGAHVPAIGTRVRAAHRVDRRFLASDGVADRLQLRERELADHGLDVRAGEAVVRTDEGGVWFGVQSRQ
jgi:hypothetical protein